jgi:hypothetical protein
VLNSSENTALTTSMSMGYKPPIFLIVLDPKARMAGWALRRVLIVRFPLIGEDGGKHWPTAAKTAECDVVLVGIAEYTESGLVDTVESGHNRHVVDLFPSCHW